MKTELCGLHQTHARLTSVPNDPQFQSSWRTIPADGVSEYVAHEEVLLQDGFLAEAGSDFYAHIVPCGSCEEGRTTGEMSDVIGGGNDNPADTLPAPKSLQTEVSPADETALTVYPNPTDDLLFVELRGAGIANVALYDLQGRVVETLRATSLQDGNRHPGREIPSRGRVCVAREGCGREGIPTEGCETVTISGVCRDAKFCVSTVSRNTIFSRIFRQKF